MPQAIGAAILWIFGVSGSAGVVIGGVTITYASIVGAIVLAAASYALRPDTPNGGGGLKAGAQQTTIRQAVPIRRRYYGRVKAAGALMLLEAKKYNAYQVVAIASQRIAQVLQYWVGDQQVFLTEAGVVTSGRYYKRDQSRIHIQTRLGTDDQDAYAPVIAEFPDIWTEDHKGNGIAHAMLKVRATPPELQARTFPGGLPSLRLVFDAACVYDWRDESQSRDNEPGWLWRDNAVICLADYLTHEDGYGLDWSYLEPALEQWTAQANIADEAVAKKGGGSEARYRLWGGYEFNEPRRQVLQRFLSACDGWVYPRSDGAIGIRIGVWEEPTVTLTDDHVLAYKLRQGNGVLRAANVIHAKFVGAEYDYQPQDADPWRDEADISARGEIARSLELETVPSHGQCRRLMKISAYRANPNWLGDIVTNAAGLDALGERFIHVAIAELGIDESFEVLQHRIELGENGPTCVMTISSMSAPAFEWDAETEEGEGPTVSDAADDGILPVPESLSVIGASSRLTASCVDPLSDELQFIFEYKKSADSAWSQISAPIATYTIQTAALAAGTYNVRAKFYGGDYVDAANVTL